MDPQLSQNPTTPNIENNNSLAKRLSDHSYSPIILTALMMVLLFLTTAFIAYKSSQPNEAAKTEVSIENEPYPTSTLQSDEQVNIDGWQTYTNEEYGYAVKYPSDWEIAAIDEFIENNEDVLHTLKLAESNPGFWQATFSVSVRNNPDQWNTDEWAENYFVPLYTSPSTNLASPSGNVKIDNENAKKLSVFAFDHQSVVIGLVKNGLIYTLSFTGETGNDPDKQIHDKIYAQILSTFEFIEPNETLLEITYEGGLCPEGVCQTNYSISSDGTVLMNDEEATTLDQARLEGLQQLIAETNYEEIKSTPFTDTCPIAYDGQEVTYTFYLQDREEVLPSCTYEIDESHPLFSQLNQIVDSLN